MPGSKNASLEKTSKGKVSIVLPQLRYSGSNAISFNEPQRVLGSSIEDRVLNCEMMLKSGRKWILVETTNHWIESCEPSTKRS